MSEDIKEQLHGLIDTAKLIDSPHIDIGSILHSDHPIYLGVEDLHNVLLDRQPPGVRLQLTEDASVTVTCTRSGEVMATLKIINF